MRPRVLASRGAVMRAEVVTWRVDEIGDNLEGARASGIWSSRD